MIKKYLSLLIALTLCVTMAGCAAQPQQEEDFFQVRTGTLSKTVYAKGETISSRTINMVEDYDLQIESALIYEGQRVLAGDVLLQLNGQYIQKKIEDAYSRIADLNQLIYSYPDMRDTVYVRPMKAGYVKDITVRRQQSVEDLMSEKDYLCLLTEEKVLEFHIEATCFSSGEEVKVTVGDAAYDGVVSAVSGEYCTIQIHEIKPRIGQQATVRKDNVRYSGELGLPNCIKITYAQGIIQKICHRENDWVEETDVLFEISVPPAAVTKAMAEIKTIKKELAWYLQHQADPYIYAANDGIVLSFAAGENVAAGEALCAIALPQGQRTVLYVDEYDIHRIAIGQNVRLTTTQGEFYTGKISDISHYGKVADGKDWAEFPVFVDTVEPLPLLGGHLTGGILVSEKENVLLVPNSAILYDDKGNAYVVLSDHQIQYVNVGEQDSVYSEIIWGLSVGDLILPNPGGK